ncbi:MAG TPA: hypothetical protein VFV32_12155 [Acidimicrobiales bacterium]|jgi:hypothetical protein|nr:hypothetical protein [Acidimicrobiales bacterium]
MRSWRLLASALAINAVDVEVAYADVFVVLREGDAQPGPTDWEATVQTAERQHLAPGSYELRAHTPDGQLLAGVAVLRFSDGQRHLFRGDGPLAGFDAAVA